MALAPPEIKETTYRVALLFGSITSLLIKPGAVLLTNARSEPTRITLPATTNNFEPESIWTSVGEAPVSTLAQVSPPSSVLWRPLRTVVAYRMEGWAGSMAKPPRPLPAPPTPVAFHG